MKTKPEKYDFVDDGEKKSLRVEWYRGKHTNYLPSKKALKKKDGILKYILEGLVPPAPFIKPKSHVVAIGSCFAREVSNYLAERGYSSLKSVKGRVGHFEFIDSGVNNTFALRQLLEWAWLGKEPSDETWHNDEKTTMERTEQRRADAAAYFSKSDVIIITLGLSEVWYNKQTDDVFWRAIPINQFDETKHGFKVSTVEENKDNLYAVLDLIETYAPNAKVVITLSPVPLIASFRPVGCLVANAVSKAILRVAVDEVMTERNMATNDKLYYWPSYEIVKEYADDPYEPDNRHITRKTVNFIMKTFSTYFVEDEGT